MSLERSDDRSRLMAARRRMARFANLTIKKQGEVDSACGLYCVLSAASHVFRDGYKARERAVFRHLARSKTLTKLFASGVGPARFRSLAEAAGLTVWRPKHVDLDAFTPLTDDAVWVALLRMRFQKARTAAAGDAVVPNSAERGDRHYVLVLDVSKRHVTVADPHPWHEDVYELKRKSFAKSWRLAQPKGGSRWAVRLSSG